MRITTTTCLIIVALLSCAPAYSAGLKEPHSYFTNDIRRPHSVKPILTSDAKRSPSFTPSKCTPSCDELVSKAQKKGSILILIGLNVSDLPGDASPKSLEARRQLVARAQDRVLSRMSGYKIKGIKRFDLTPGMAATVDAQGLKRLLADPEVRTIREERPSRPALLQSAPLIGADQAWAAGFRGTGYAIAVLDTGVDKAHPFLATKVNSEACFSSSHSGNDPQLGLWTVAPLCPNALTEQIGPGAAGPCEIAGCEHGTHVAGIAAGANADFSGVAASSTLIAVQVFSRGEGAICDPNPSPCLLSYPSDQIRALDYIGTLATNQQIAAINMSLGGLAYSDYCDNEEYDTKVAIDLLRAAGVATVVASGNAYEWSAISTPACISTAVSVGSTTKTDDVAPYSNSARFLNILAPGGDGGAGIVHICTGGAGICSSISGGGYAYLSGTSMAAPHVAAAWAVLKSQSPTASVSDALSILSTSGTPILDSRNNVRTPRIKIGKLPWLSRYDGPPHFDDVATSVATDSLGNTYVAGYSCQDEGCDEQTITTIKYDANGQQAWAARYNTGCVNETTGITVDRSGDIFVIAAACATNSNSNYITIKYDSTGNQLWVREYDNGGYDYPRAITADSEGNVFVTGSSCVGPGDCLGCFTTCNVIYDMAIATVKYGSDGQQLWAHRYANGNPNDAYVIEVHPSGNIYLAGFSGTSASPSWDPHPITLQLTPSGNLAWSAIYPNGGEAQAIAVDTSGAVYVAGWDSGTTINDPYKYLVVKYDAAGNELWRLTPKEGFAVDIILDTNNYAYVTGRGDYNEMVESTYDTMKLSPSGQIIWESALVTEASGEPVAIAIDSGSNVYVTGGIRNHLGELTTPILEGGNYYVTIKYNSAGQELKRWLLHTENADFKPSLALDSTGNPIVVGAAYRSLDEWISDFVTQKFID